jgi:hypothetical protein
MQTAARELRRTPLPRTRVINALPGLHHFTTRYLRCVTLGESMTLVTSSSTGSGSMRSNSRTPSPSSTGARWTWISSTSPASRNCWTTFAPPAILTSFPPAASLARSRAPSMPSVTKWKVVPPCLTQGSLGLPVRTNTGARKGGDPASRPLLRRTCACPSRRRRRGRWTP